MKLTAAVAGLGLMLGAVAPFAAAAADLPDLDRKSVV